MVWGHSAVDMKDINAMILTNIRHLARNSVRPPRNLVFTFFANKKTNSTKKSH